MSKLTEAERRALIEQASVVRAEIEALRAHMASRRAELAALTERAKGGAT